MKIIELLNKIAKGEEIPKKINVYCYLWTFDIEKHDYTNIHDTALFNDFIDNIITDSLNDEVEIIEEEKEIEELRIADKVCDWNLKDQAFQNKINELVVEVNKLKRDKNGR